jgi:hypothetical protein
MVWLGRQSWIKVIRPLKTNENDQKLFEPQILILLLTALWTAELLLV